MSRINNNENSGGMTETTALIFSAITISILHTASGPDHYLPFIVLSRSRKWSKSRTIALTVICGLGHIFSSVLIGLIGVVMGWQLAKLTWLQDIRGNFSAWALLLFGLLYLIWGLWRACTNRPHQHYDMHDNEIYVNEHRHGNVSLPQHRVKVTPLVLVAIFVMGPSEPLVPLLFYSGIHKSAMEISVLITVFAVCTVLTMVGMVLLGLYGFSFFSTMKIERYIHAISGAILTACGVCMVFLGW